MKKLNVSKLGMALAVVVALFAFSLSADAKKKTVLVQPDKAKIFVNGNEVGNGSYVINFTKGLDIAVLRFEQNGYLPRTVKLFKDDPRSTVVYKLEEDESWVNSMGAEDGIDYANKSFDIIAKKGMTADAVWKRLMNIATSNFENIEIRDKAAGWIRTGWAQQRFNVGNDDGFTVRTRLEIKMQFLDEDEVAFKATIQSRRAEGSCGLSDNCFFKWDRVLKKYVDVISELTTTLGSGR